MMSAVRTDRMKAALGCICAAAIAVLAGCSSSGFEGTTRCNAAVAEVVYDPGKQVEIRVGGQRVGWADAGDRELNEEACERVATQTEWFVGVEYMRVTQPMTIRCRFAQRFYVHAHPTSSSESGETFPDGSALYLVAEEAKTIVASAAIADDPAEGSLRYARSHCGPL